MEKTQAPELKINTTKEYHIMVVEDKGSDFRLLELSLNRSELDCVLYWAPTAEAALTLLRTQTFDIVLLDFVLPDTSGLELFKEMKRFGLDLSVIFVTGMGDERAAVDAFNHGAQDYLIKDSAGEYLNLLPYIIEKGYRQWEDGRERLRSELALIELNENLKKKIEEGTQEIRQREALTTAILSSLEPHIAVLDRTGKIIAINSAWEKYAQENGAPSDGSTGVGAQYLEVTRKAAETGDPDAQIILTGLTDVLSGKTIDFSCEYPCHSPQREQWYSLNITSLNNQYGGIVTSHTDITDRKLVLNQEKEQRLWAETLQQISSFLNRSLNLEKVLQGLLEQLNRVVDFQSASVMMLHGDVLKIVAYHDKKGKPQYSKNIAFQDLSHVKKVLLEQKPVYVANTILDSRWKQLPGTTYIQSWVGVPLVAHNTTIGMLNLNHIFPNYYSSKLIRMTVSVANQAAVAIENARLYSQATKEIEERRRAEVALEAERATLAHRVSQRTLELTQANKKLSQALQAKDQFLANMSHELRTPLTAILGKTEVLLEGYYDPLTSKQMKAVKIIESSSEHLLSLINDILDVAQIESGHLNLHWENVALKSLCEASLNFVHDAANKKGIKINKAFNSTVEIIQGDNRRLKQILVNLLNNAVKFTPEGGEIGLEVNSDQANGRLNIVVWDTGIGISEEGKHRLFGEMNRPKPFFQLENTLSRQYQGSGLGLVLVYTLTALHKGSIQIESLEGKGTRMTVSLPITNGIRPSSETAEPNHLESNPMLGTAKLKRLGQRILLAEDNQYTIDGLVDYLTYLGFDVTVALDGEEAVRKTAELNPDLIIMDVQLPKRNGLEAMKMIRSDLGLKDTPIIALTALTMPGDREKCLSAGANEYIRKPFNLRQITEVISHHSTLEI